MSTVDRTYRERQRPSWHQHARSEQASRTHLVWRTVSLVKPKCLKHLGMLLVLLATGARADQAPPFRLIVPLGQDDNTLERRFVADAFLKKVTRWPDGSTIQPVDLSHKSRARRVFSEHVLRRSVGAVRSYWQQRIFSGRDVPPPEVASDAAVIQYVKQTPGAIGYVSGEAKLSGVQAVSLE